MSSYLGEQIAPTIILQTQQLSPVLRPDNTPMIIGTGLTLLSIILFIVIRQYNPKFLNQLFYSILKHQSAKKLYLEKSSITQRSNFVLNIVMILNYSVLLFYYVISNNSTLISIGLATTLLICGAIVVGYFLLKGVLYYSFAFIIGQIPIRNEYISIVILHYRVLGLVLFPINILLPFINNTYFDALFIIICVFFSIAFLLTTFRGITVGVGIKFPYVYMILYFCILELTPLMLVIKWSSNIIF